jgi:hypothetical protein
VVPSPPIISFFTSEKYKPDADIPSTESKVSPTKIPALCAGLPGWQLLTRNGDVSQMSNPTPQSTGWEALYSSIRENQNRRQSNDTLLLSVHAGKRKQRLCKMGLGRFDGINLNLVH